LEIGGFEGLPIGSKLPTCPQFGVDFISKLAPEIP
jgi:hypothetical protein